MRRQNGYRRYGYVVGMVSLLAASIVACGQDTPLATGPLGAIEVSIEPNPVTAVASQEPEMQWSAAFNVHVRETSGVGGVIEFINVSPTQDDFTGISGFYHGDHAIEAAVGTARIEANGSLTIPIQVSYTLSSGGRAASAEVHVHFFYDRGIGNVTGAAILEII